MLDDDEKSEGQPPSPPYSPVLAAFRDVDPTGLNRPFRTNFIWPPLDPDNQPPPFLLAVKRAEESCVFKAALSCVAGGGLGLLFGLFFGGYANAVDKAVDMQGSTMVKLRVGVREAWRAMASYSKNFARFGVLFSGSECVIEKVRARHDIYNAVSGGCFTGATMAAAPFEKLPVRARATQMAIGCASLAAFSAAIDYYMEYMD